MTEPAARTTASSLRRAPRYADAITPTGETASDDLYAELAAHWNAGQIVEITSVIILFNCFKRFAVALCIPVSR